MVPYPTAGPRALRSSRGDGGPQVLPPARVTLPPWLPAKSARVSNLPACCALGPPACAAHGSCSLEIATCARSPPRAGGSCPGVLDCVAAPPEGLPSA